MNYPEHIYSKFKIIEKEIYGQTHYCAVKESNFLGFTFYKNMKVRRLFPGGYFDSSGATWCEDKSSVLSAIKSWHQREEWRFAEKVRK